MNNNKNIATYDSKSTPHGVAATTLATLVEAVITIRLYLGGTVNVFSRFRRIYLPTFEPSIHI